jgi:hypothetical protein
MNHDDKALITKQREASAAGLIATCLFFAFIALIVMFVISHF